MQVNPTRLPESKAIQNHTNKNNVPEQIFFHEITGDINLIEFKKLKDYGFIADWFTTFFYCFSD